MCRDVQTKQPVVLFYLFARCFHSDDAIVVAEAHQCLAFPDDLADGSAGLQQLFPKHKKADRVDDIMQDLAPYGLICPL